MSAPLAAHHREMLEDASSIRADVIEARGYRTVTDSKDLKDLSFTSKQRNVPALLIPIYSPTGEQRLYQARPDTPRLNDKSKAVKYETPAGAQMALDMHPLVKDKAGDPKTPLWVTEGIKKGDALVSRGLCTVALIGVWNFRGTNDEGGKVALPEWEYIALNGREVYIVFDSDVMQKKEVAKALERLKAMLEHRGAKVNLVYLPETDKGEKQGVDDYLAAGHGVNDLLELATSELKTPTGKRPEIVITERWLRDISDDSKDALLAANEPPSLFMRGTLPARIVADRIEALTNTMLKGHLDRIADFVKLTYRPGKGSEPVPKKTPTRPPSDLAPDLLTRQDLGLPELDDLVFAPVFLPGGELLARDGYNAEHRLLLRMRGLTDIHSNMPMSEALEHLRTIYRDFPFADEAGFAHTLAMTLQPFVRPLIEGATPMYLIDAPARGTGKGLLAEISNLIPLGSFAPTMSQPRDSDELEKRITAALLEARPVVFFDNVTRLGSDPLHAVLTSQVWHGRILGKSETVTVANRAVWLASGNNVELSDEMARRIIPIRLDAGVERPEDRTGFSIPDLPGYVRQHRSELVSACLSLIQAWVHEGMPRGTATLGRFESWAGILGGILEVAGIEGFLKGRERIYAEADKETNQWVAFFEAWWQSYGPRAVTASDLFEIAKERKLLLDLWGGRSDLSARQRFGRALISRRDRVFAGYKLQSAGRDAINNTNAYRLEPVQTPETPKTPSDVLEAPSPTSSPITGFEPGSKRENPETPAKPGNPTNDKNAVQNGKLTQDTQPDRVSGVSEPTPSYSPEHVRHLVGTTEGEL